MNASTRDEAAPDNGETLTLSQAAARLGISEKTLRKRIHAGEFAGEKVPLDGGGVGWAVHLARDIAERDGNAPEAERNFTVPRAGSGTEPIHSQNTKNQGAERKRAGSGTVNAPEVTVTRAGSVPEVATESESARVLAESEAAFLRDALEVARANETFLRGLIEQRDRDAAELRAALRKALEAMPKALPSREYSQTPESAQDANVAPKGNAAPKVSGTAGNTAQRAPRREMRPLWKVILGIR